MATKQNNFYLQYQLAAKAGKNADRKAFLRKAAPGVLIVAGCMLAWGGVFLHTAMMRADIRDLRAWCADEQNLTPYRQSLQDQQAADAYHSLTDYANSVTSLLASYPDQQPAQPHRRGRFRQRHHGGVHQLRRRLRGAAVQRHLQYRYRHPRLRAGAAKLRRLFGRGLHRLPIHQRPGPARRVRAEPALHLGRTGITL